MAFKKSIIIHMSSSDDRRVIMQHTLILVQNRYVKKVIIAVKISQKLSYPEAHKCVESRNLPVRFSYSSLFKQQSKSVRYISTQTESSPPPNSLMTLSFSTPKNKPIISIVSLMENLCQSYNLGHHHQSL